MNRLKQWIVRRSKRSIRAAFLIFFLVDFSWIVVPPLFDIINRAEPWVFGMPFVLFMIIVVCVLACIGLWILFEIESLRGELQ